MNKYLPKQYDELYNGFKQVNEELHRLESAKLLNLT